jgi:hypothetical protein
MTAGTGSPPEDRGEHQPASVLSGEELRALLSPAPGEGATDPVLLLAPQPEDASPLRARFQEAGVAVLGTVNCFSALDLLRARPCRGLVAWASALPADLTWYRSRVREIDPALRLCVVQDREDRSLPADLPRVGPALGEAAFQKLLDHLGVSASRPRVSAPAHHGAAPRASEPTPKQTREVSPSTAPPQPPEQRTSQPDPFLAVRALLEARLAGKSPEEGLLRWARQDPGLRGWVRQGEEKGEIRLRAAADPGGDRKSMVLVLLEQLAQGGPSLREPVSFGPFAVFPHSLAKGSWVAVWHRDAAAAERTVRGLQAVIPLLRELAPVTPHAPGDRARDRLVSLLGTRMHAAERRQGRLGLLLFEGRRDDAAQLCKVLRALLRGGDWVEPIGSRVYVILEEPDQRVFAALGSRLRELPGVDRLRLVALGWTPLEGDAGQLLERAEGILDSGGQGEGLPGVTG